jgi:hypothetical protein
MLGKGTTQERAIEELVSLPADHPYRRDVLELLANLKATLEAQKPTEPEEQELVMKLSPIYLADLADAKETGRQEGRQEGRHGWGVYLRLSRHRLRLYPSNDWKH